MRYNLKHGSASGNEAQHCLFLIYYYYSENYSGKSSGLSVLIPQLFPVLKDYSYRPNLWSESHHLSGLRGAGPRSAFCCAILPVFSLFCIGLLRNLWLFSCSCLASFSIFNHFSLLWMARILRYGFPLAPCTFVIKILVFNLLSCSTVKPVRRIDSVS